MAALELSDVDALPVGDHRVVAVPGGKPPHVSLIVTRTQEGLRAFWNICQHLPVPLDSGSQRLIPGDELVCLTHGARFRATDGRCVAGPCEGASLESVELEQRRGVWFAQI